jgi:hypothetical protein
MNGASRPPVVRSTQSAVRTVVPMTASRCSRVPAYGSARTRKSRNSTIGERTAWTRNRKKPRTSSTIAP